MPIVLDGTKGTTPASWTTAGRPASPSAGQFGLNTTLGYLEWYSATTSLWIPFSESLSYAITYLVVAGGAGGGSNYGGGGGAGGLLTGVASISPATSYSITVGAGGNGGNTNFQGGSGTNSVIGTLGVTALGGGGGAPGSGFPINGTSGGCGGGGNGYSG